MPTPKTIGACADKLYNLREERQKLQRQIDKIEEKEKEIKDYLINTLPKSDAQGVSGRVAKVGITQKAVATVKDWNKFYRFILKTKNFVYLQRRVSDAPIKELWESGKKVPGVEPFNVIGVSVTKL